MAANDSLGFTVRQRVGKPVDIVYNAVADPDIMSTYFTTRVEGTMASGATVIWHWGEINDETRVDEMVPNERLVFSWKAYQVDYRTRCVFTFHPHETGGTIVEVHEEGWSADKAGYHSMCEHCSGWTHMLLCLKARLEYDIDLRK